MNDPTPERCGNEAGPAYVTDPRCNLIRGHRGDCSFGTAHPSFVKQDESDARKLLFSALGLMVTVGIAAVVICVAVIIVALAINGIEWAWTL